MLVTSLLWVACGDDKEDPCVSGKGGAVDLMLFPQHHGEAIPGIPNYVDSAFIKFNTREFPGDNASKYDLIITGQVGSDSVLVEGLKCGDYFVPLHVRVQKARRVQADLFISIHADAFFTPRPQGASVFVLPSWNGRFNVQCKRTTGRRIVRIGHLYGTKE